MKIDGLHLLEGSQITNPVVAHGTSFPTGPANPPDIGEIFYLTSGNVGLHYCSATDGTNGTWIKIASAEMDPDLVAIASLVGNTGLLKKTAANTWTLDTTAYATQSGLNAVAGAPGKLMVGDSWPPTPEPLQMFYATTAIDTSPKGFYYWDVDNAMWVEVQPALASWDIISGTPTTLAGYGITDAYTKTETYTQAEVDSAISAATPTFASLTGKPTTLAGYGITDGQPLDGDLSSIAGLSGTSGILTKTAVDTWTLDTNTYLTAHPSVSGATSANNSGLTYVQDLTFDANGHVTGIQSVAVQSASTSQSGVVQLSDSTSTTSSSLGATSTAVKSAYDVATAALPKAGGSMTGSIVIPTGQKITITDAPVLGTDAANKNYVDANLAGLSWKDSVKAATNGNITLSGAQTVDGIALVAGDRVLVKNQTSASQNGIYVVAAGAWTRATDMDATTPINEINSAAVFVEQGTVYADTGWTQTFVVNTIDFDQISFTQFNGAAGITAGIGLTKTGNTLDISLGAGIAQLPTDEVGIDVYATGGLMTTVDGTNSSSLTNAQLSLTKVGTAGTYKSVTTDDFGRVTAGSNPTTLAEYGITDAQALDADLTAIAALAGTSGFLKKTAADTWTLDTTTYATDSLAMHLAGAETATGLKTFSAGIKLPDASTFYLGTDNDLAFSHSGVAGTITNNTGNLTIGTSATGGSLFLRTNNTSGSYIGILSADATVYANTFYVKTQSAGTTMLTMNTGGASFSASISATGNVNSQATVTCSSFYTRQYIPLIASLGDQADNVYDRGWSYKWHNGSVAKTGYFGLDKSTGKFTFVPDASITSDVVTGTKGTIDAYLAWADVTGKPTTLSGYGITDAVSSSHLTDETLHLTSAQNTWIDAITVTSAEVNYLSGATSSIQTQLDAKMPRSGGIFTGNIAIYTTGNASLEMGRLDGISATPYIDFHSGATVTDYDSRIIAGGGNGTSAQGTLSIIAGGGLTLTGPITASNTINGTTIPTSATLLVTNDIGSTVQAYDADLSAIGALVGTTGILKKTAANTWSLDTTAYAVDNTVVHLTGNETITGAKTFSGVVTNFINGSSTSGAEVVVFKGTDYGAGNPYMYIKHSTTLSNEYHIGLWDGTGSIGTINFNAGIVKVSSLTNSTSSSTGAFVVTGGVGIGEDLNVGLTATISGMTTMNSGAIIQAAGATDALRITQTGTGNALLVEDSTNPDSTPFVINQYGKVIIGDTVAAGGGMNWSLQANSANTDNGIGITQYGNNTYFPTLAFGKTRGSTSGSWGGAVQNNDILGTIRFYGDTGSAAARAAAISTNVDGTPAVGSMPGKLIFSTSPVGSETPVERLSIDSTGLATFSNGVDISNVDNQLKITRNGNQYLLIENNDITTFPLFVSYSDIANAKVMKYDARTDAAGTAPTGGNLGHIFTINGIEKLGVYSTSTTVTGNLTVSGNLTINGTTTTVNSTTVTIDDPVFTLGGDVAAVSDDNKDRGIEFRYHNGTTAKTGFFGFDDSTGKFTFIPDATNTSEVFSGTKGTIDANIDWADILNKPSSGAGAGTVTSVSVVSANGFAGSVATATSTPAITISTSITGLLKGNGTAISAAVAGTDYLSPSTTIDGGSF